MHNALETIKNDPMSLVVLAVLVLALIGCIYGLIREK